MYVFQAHERTMADSSSSSKGAKRKRQPPKKKQLQKQPAVQGEAVTTASAQQQQQQLPQQSTILHHFDVVVLPQQQQRERNRLLEIQRQLSVDYASIYRGQLAERIRRAGETAAADAEDARSVSAATDSIDRHVLPLRKLEAMTMSVGSEQTKKFPSSTIQSSVQRPKMHARSSSYVPPEPPKFERQRSVSLRRQKAEWKRGLKPFTKSMLEIEYYTKIDHEDWYRSLDWNVWNIRRKFGADYDVPNRKQLIDWMFEIDPLLNDDPDAVAKMGWTSKESGNSSDTTTEAEEKEEGKREEKEEERIASTSSCSSDITKVKKRMDEESTDEEGEENDTKKQKTKRSWTDEKRDGEKNV